MATEVENESLIKHVDHAIRLPAFEGPLDLLLFLIRKNEIDIYDIPLETVTKQYLDILNSMEEVNLEVAGEFFVMAATLMQIKSRMLLPRPEQIEDLIGDDEEIDPRWELVQQLIEYKKFKEAAGNLDELIEEASRYLQRQYDPNREEAPERPLKPSSQIEVWNAFNQVLRRLSESIIVGQIHEETVTVADRMEFLLDQLKIKGSFTFSSIFGTGKTQLHVVVATFLAILELSRLKYVNIEQTALFDDIYCQRQDADEDRNKEFDFPE